MHTPNIIISGNFAIFINASKNEVPPQTIKIVMVAQDLNF